MNIRYGIMLLSLVLNLGADNAPINNAPIQKHIVLVAASYKNAEWYQWNLDSVFSQDYDNWTMIYVDDCSPDNTAGLVANYVKEKGFEDKVVLVCNENRRGAMENQYFAINHFCKPTDIVVILDGDDRLAHNHVLSYINDVYADGNTWLTYGQFREFPSGGLGFCVPIPEYVVAQNRFREYGQAHGECIPSHLRTFYAGLFHKIKLPDLMYDGVFMPMAPDMAAMIPMIEMARDHFKFIPEVLLDYNAVNPISEHRVSKDLQRSCDLRIRAMARYDKIETPF